MDAKPKDILPSAMELSLESMKNSSWMKSGSEPFLSATHPSASAPSRTLIGVRALLTVIGDSVNKMPPRFDPNLFSDDDDDEEEEKRSCDAEDDDDESPCCEDEEMESYDVKNVEGNDSFDTKEKEKRSNDVRENIHTSDVKKRDESFLGAASVSMGSNKSLQITDKIDSTDSCSMKSLNSATRGQFVYNRTTDPISSASVKPPIMERGKRSEPKFQHCSDLGKPDSQYSASSRSKLEGQESNTIDDYNWKKLLTSNILRHQANSAVKVQHPENGKICDLPKQRSSARKNMPRPNASRSPLKVLKQAQSTDISKKNDNIHSVGKDALKFHHDSEGVDDSACNKQKPNTHVSHNASLRTPSEILKPYQCADISKEDVNIHSRGENVNKFHNTQEQVGHAAHEKQRQTSLISQTAPSRRPLEVLKSTHTKKNANTCSGQKSVNKFCHEPGQSNTAGCKKKLIPQVSQNYPENKQNVVVYQGNVTGPSGSGAQSMLSLDVLVVNKKPYACLDVLGSGGSSKVYSVYDASTKSTFAVKHVNLGNADHGVINGYKKEIEYLQMLQGSERVIKMFDYEYRDKELYIVLEKGCNDFAHYLANATKNGPLPPVRIKHFWLQMLEAVAEIHKHGIVHSDLKPANFLVVSGDLKLIDFGIADKVPADMTSAVRETQVGTLNYISPEALTCQSDGNYGEQKYIIKVGVKADVWSLGCILYNVVYGHTPFQSMRMVAQKIRAIIDPNYEIPFTPIDDVLLLDVLKSCLRRNPKERASVEELLNHPYLDSKATNKVPCTPVKSRRNFQDMLHELESLTPGRMGVIYDFIAQKKNESVKKQQLP